ncbi:MAG: protein translocase subunit SecD [Burkholderiaceae bacterium]
MNRYPLWKYIVIAVALAVGLLYALPNVFGEAPAVQVTSGKATIKVDASMMTRVDDLLKKANIATTGTFFDNGQSPSVRIRVADNDTQLHAKDVLEQGLNPNADDKSYVVALNLVADSPRWLTAIHALPMYLGLDLRGGVHFLMQVDMKSALSKRLDALTGDARTLLRDKNIRHNGIARNASAIEVSFTDAETAAKARPVLEDGLPEMTIVSQTDGASTKLVATFRPEAIKSVQDNALKQNISTLHNRVNQLGVSEPVIQQQGGDRIVVELPGVQDTAKAKDIIGRTATLEARLVDESAEAQSAVASGTVPFGDDKFTDRNGVPLLVKKQVIFSGDNLTDAQPGFDENQQPDINLNVDAKGARALRDTTRENIGKRMALILFEKGKGEVVTAPTIQSELGNRFRITGRFTASETTDTALVLRSGSLAAPMEIIEERSIGPSLGADNIRRGFLSTVYGFAAIAVFMILYYRLFGVISVVALAANLLFLLALLSMLQATLTLPGVAAIALALGMAIDSNVLINERIREELRHGKAPQAAIAEGYERAFGTIIDSNITTLIAGLALLAFGSGPIRGFAVVHCLGILTSIFSSVFVSRGLVNLIYGRKKKLASVAIGQVWRPDAKTA